MAFDDLGLLQVIAKTHQMGWLVHLNPKRPTLSVSRIMDITSLRNRGGERKAWYFRDIVRLGSARMNHDNPITTVHLKYPVLWPQNTWRKAKTLNYGFWRVVKLISYIRWNWICVRHYHKPTATSIHEKMSARQQWSLTVVGPLFSALMAWQCPTICDILSSFQCQRYLVWLNCTVLLRLHRSCDNFEVIVFQPDSVGLSVWQGGPAIAKDHFNRVQSFWPCNWHRWIPDDQKDSENHPLSSMVSQPCFPVQPVFPWLNKPKKRS